MAKKADVQVARRMWLIQKVIFVFTKSHCYVPRSWQILEIYACFAIFELCLCAISE